MNALLDVLEPLGAASVHAFWLPLAVWTAVWLAAEAGLRACRPSHPAVRYRITQAVLLTLPVGLLLAALVDLSALLPQSAPALAFVPDLMPLTAPSPELTVLPTESAAPARTFTLAALLGLGVVLVALVAAVRLLRLAVHAVALHRLRRSLQAVHVPGLEGEVRAVADRLGVRRPVEVIATDAEVVPMTFGLWRPLVVLPAALSPEERRLAVAHELAHVRQGDYAAQWVEALVAAVFAVHPAVHRLRQRCDLLREMSCDAALLADPAVSRRAYASLVYAFVSPPAPVRPTSVGMADSTPHVNQRLRAMQTYRPPSGTSPHRAGWLLAAVVLLCGSLLVTAAQVIAQPDPHLSASQTALPDDPLTGAVSVSDTTEVFVVVEEPPQLIGGLEGLLETVRYPEEARQAGIEGTVFVQFVVDEQGRVIEPRVIRGVGSGLDEAALAAVREARFVPGRQRGEPVRVQFSLPIRFQQTVPPTAPTPPAAPARPAAPVPPAAPAPPSPRAGDASDTTEVYTMVEEPPQLIGGLAGLQERVRYPEEARRAGIQGTVFVQFVVDEQGRVIEPRVVRGVGSGLDEAALAAVREARFEPGRQRGRLVKVRFSLPIRFQLPEADPDPQSGQPDAPDTVSPR